jgi:hypothetical protein
MGVEVFVVAFDPVIDATKNLLDDKQFSDMCDLAGCEDAFGAFGGGLALLSLGFDMCGSLVAPDLCDHVTTRLNLCLG